MGNGNMTNPIQQFKNYFYNPIILIAVGTALLGVLTFVINAKLVSPLAFRVAQNEKKLEKHEEWCEKKIPEMIIKRPTSDSLTPKFEALEKFIGELKEDQKEYQRNTNDKLDKIYNVLINRGF